MTTKPHEARVERLLHDSLLTRGSDPCFAQKAVVVIEGQPHTYVELLDHAQRLAAALLARGVTRGDRVAIYMNNS